MVENTKIIRAVRTNGTKETLVTIGDFRGTLTRWEALHLLKDLFLSVWGSDFNEEALRQEQVKAPKK